MLETGYNLVNPKEWTGDVGASRPMAYQERSPDVRYKSIPTLTPSQLNRFWSKVDTSSGPDGCWLWQAAISSVGYGVVGLGGRANGLFLAHRVSFTIECGQIPEGLQIDHICKVRKCVNPAHLESVTQRENILRGGGMSAIHARQTHCCRGHEFSEANTIIDTLGRRVCRICRRAKSKANSANRRKLAA